MTGGMYIPLKQDHVSGHFGPPLRVWRPFTNKESFKPIWVVNFPAASNSCFGLETIVPFIKKPLFQHRESETGHR